MIPTFSRLFGWFSSNAGHSLLYWLYPLLVSGFYLYRYRSPTYFLVTLAAFAIAAWLQRPIPPLQTGSSLKPSTLAPLAFSPAILLTLLALFQYFVMLDAGDVDMSCYTTAFWNLARGNLYLTLYSANYFSGHSNYLSVLFIPIFLALDNYGLIIAQSALLIFAIHLLTRNLGGWDWEKVLITAAIALSPAFAAKMLFGFHADVLGAPFLLLAVLAYRRESLKGLLAFIPAVVFSKEIFVLGIGSLILLALFERRNWRWIAYPFILGCLLIGFYWYLIVPLLSTEGSNLYSGWMPRGPGEWLLLMARAENLEYFLRSLLPFLPLFHAVGWKYAVLPLPFLLFYAGFPDPSFRDLARHYSLAFGVMAWSTLIFADPRRLKKWGLSLFLCMLLSYPNWRGLVRLGEMDWQRAQTTRELQHRIPPEASLVVHSPAVSRFADRRYIANWVYGEAYSEKYDYVLLDMGYQPEWWPGRHDLVHRKERLQSSLVWENVFEQNGIHLFRRK